MSTRKTTLDVDGMTCSSCVRHVEAALRDLEGVSKIEVDLEHGKVVVEHADASPAIATMLEALGDAGYESRPAAAAAH